MKTVSQKNTRRSTALPVQVSEQPYAGELPALVDCRLRTADAGELIGIEAWAGRPCPVPPPTVQITGLDVLERKRAVMVRAVRVFVPGPDRGNGIKLLLRAAAALEVAS